MKKFLSVFLAIALLFGSMASYSTLEVEGLTVASEATLLNPLTYELSNDGTGYVVSGYKANRLEADLVIPEAYKRKPVVGIGASAFANCEMLVSVEVPDTVKFIGDSAFEGCENLQSVTFPGPTALEKIGASAFADCAALSDFFYSINLKEIGTGAFANCTSLNNTFAFDGIVKMGAGAFTNTAYYNDTNNWVDGVLYTASYLLEANPSMGVIPANYQVKDNTALIADSAFAYCAELETITLADTVAYIGEYAFENCYNLYDVAFSYSLQDIGTYAFSGCTALQNIELPAGVEKIAPYTFADCTGLTDVVVSDGTVAIEANAFSYCTSLYNVFLPDSVEKIGKEAFSNCYALTNIRLGKALSSIDEKAFYNCYHLNLIEFPVNLQIIGKEAFYNCYTFDHLSLSQNLKRIGERAFANCYYLKHVVIPQSVNTIGKDAFLNCDSLLIHGAVGTRAQSYAEEYYIPFREVGTSSLPAPKIQYYYNDSGFIMIIWDEIPEATSYNVYKRKAGEKDEQLIAVNTTDLYVADDEVEHNTYYSYRVEAVSFMETSIKSDKVLLKYVDAPKLLHPVSTAYGVQVNWQTVPGVQNYRVYRQAKGDLYWTYLATVQNSTYLDSAIKDISNDYIYTVRAEDFYFSGFRIPVNYHHYVAAPRMDSIWNAVNGIGITWSATDTAASYNVYRRAAGSADWKLIGNTESTFYIDEEVNYNSGNYYRYTAVAVEANLLQSEPESGIYTKRVSTPYLYGIKNSKSGISFAWANVPGATEYRVYRRGIFDSNWTYIDTTSSTSYLDTAIRNNYGYHYYYTVVAVDGGYYSNCEDGIYMQRA